MGLKDCLHNEEDGVSSKFSVAQYYHTWTMQGERLYEGILVVGGRKELSLGT